MGQFDPDAGHGETPVTEQEFQRLLSVAVHGEHGIIWIDDQLLAGGPYTAWYPELLPGRPTLRVTLHSDSVASASGEAATHRDWLVATGRHNALGEKGPDIDLKVTVLRRPGSMDWARGLGTLGEGRRSRFGDGLYQQPRRADWDQTRSPEQPPANILDLRMHEKEDRHVFVTLDDSLLAAGLTPNRLNKSFVVPPILAQHYIDLYLKAQGAFRVMPNYSVNRGLYYWMRLWSLVPAFQAAWPYAVFGANVAPRGQDVYDFMQALHARITGMMQAHDRLGWLRYTPANNDTRDEMLNQLNYFIVLATGVFDSIAWLALHRFQIGESLRNITSRAEPNGRPNPYFKKLDACAPVLVQYLRDPIRQAKIALFYQPRDSIQHRLVLTGAHFNTGQYLSDCNVVFLDSEAAKAIQAVDRHDPATLPFSEWGLVYANEERPLLEPYRFTGEALRFVLSFVDETLEHLDLATWLAPYPKRKLAAEAAADIGRRQNCPRFATPFQ